MVDEVEWETPKVEEEEEVEDQDNLEVTKQEVVEDFLRKYNCV